MREIKFRAWDRCEQVMQQHEDLIRNACCEPWDSDGKDWMQFTGLKDRIVQLVAMFLG